MLDRILEAKRMEIAACQERMPLQRLLGEPKPRQVPVFSQALKRPGLNIIAEVKYRSPSHGPFACRKPPEDIARQYRDSGAAAISVLTDEPFFQGKLEYLSRIREALDSGATPPATEKGSVRTAPPLLRKDFILDRYQIAEGWISGASAFLLIVACLSPAELVSLIGYGGGLGVEALVEVHDPRELEVALKAGARIIGVNNRDLRTFKVDLGTSFKIARMMEGEDGCLLVAESGLSGHSQLVELKDAGFAAFLIGSAFMEADDPGAALARLLGKEWPAEDEA